MSRQEPSKETVLLRNINLDFDEQLTIGERIADKVAEFGGSWKFIMLFTGIILFWIILNTAALLHRAFDPYPFILLNLVLSCLAALQAPIIMMSQNRQSKKDRMLADHDYRTNQKAEVEVRELNRKLDLLISQHVEKIEALQKLQLELIEHIAVHENQAK